jgi:hypothetical protein
MSTWLNSRCESNPEPADGSIPALDGAADPSYTAAAVSSQDVSIPKTFIRSAYKHTCERANVAYLPGYF